MSKHTFHILNLSTYLLYFDMVILNGCDICLHTTNYQIFYIQDFINGLWSSMSELFLVWCPHYEIVTTMFYVVAQADVPTPSQCIKERTLMGHP